MSMESLIVGVLDPLVAGKCWPDVGPDAPTLPYITYQQVGGDAINFITGGQPSKANARVQVNVWAATRMQAKALAQQAETALRGVAALQTEVLGAPSSTYDDVTKYRGTIQFFSCWTDVA
ncbi:DUF3168 domain-containing protein [Oxalobacteraceae bacterium]|nr:DUF3168 domain-containing protein [Oxalobacteraceae bacterium]